MKSLAARAGIPAPSLWVIDDPQPNAFATGRNPDHAAVAVTTGLLHKLHIVNPLAGGGINRLFATHPPVQDRIRRLLDPAPVR